MAKSRRACITRGDLAADARQHSQDPAGERPSVPILSDKGGDVGALFGLRWVVPDDMRPIHIRLGGPMPTFNGEDSWTLPMPAR